MQAADFSVDSGTSGASGWSGSLIWAAGDAADKTLTVTVPGAAVGDVVAIGLPATVNAGIVFDARVSAADTLTVRAMNITASPVDPASATYDFVVFKI